eukprot:11510321-Alexandrium_andersonii.AAC.1
MGRHSRTASGACHGTPLAPVPGLSPPCPVPAPAPAVSGDRSSLPCRMGLPGEPTGASSPEGAPEPVASTQKRTGGP